MMIRFCGNWLKSLAKPRNSRKSYNEGLLSSKNCAARSFLRKISVIGGLYQQKNCAKFRNFLSFNFRDFRKPGKHPLGGGFASASPAVGCRWNAESERMHRK